ncbi:putative polyprotein [Senna tora]|uniref:Putative polyprotein n=1 Tax=Senna tora TaxID=362788 RepID=A0A835CKF7_9FABA|nr:putative polyprotein [Senna tora]
MQPFGCACYPCLKPYNEHKLQFHSQLCVFLGPATQQKGFKFLSSTGRVYVSRHEIFDTSVFPFASGFLNRKGKQAEIHENGKIPLFLVNPSDACLKSGSEKNMALDLDNSDSMGSSSRAENAPTDSHSAAVIRTRDRCHTEALNRESRESSSGDSSGTREYSSSGLNRIECDDGPTLTLETRQAHEEQSSRPNSVNEPERNQAHQRHHMVTRAQVGVHKPKHPYIVLLHTKNPLVLALASEPRNITEALASPHWKRAMEEELHALQRNQTWSGAFRMLGARLHFSFFGPKVFILIYVDDILVTGNNTAYLKTFVQRLNALFSLKDLGPVYYFLGIKIY